jgi:type IV secretory pathway VirB2 component (pilin)
MSKLIKVIGYTYIIKYCFLCISIILIADYAIAADKFTHKFCELTTIIQGPIGVGISIIAIIGLSLTFLFGKIDMRTFFLTLFAILGLFYSQDIANLISGNSYTCSSPSGTGTTQGTTPTNKTTAPPAQNNSQR